LIPIAISKNEYFQRGCALRHLSRLNLTRLLSISGSDWGLEKNDDRNNQFTTFVGRIAFATCENDLSKSVSRTLMIVFNWRNMANWIKSYSIDFLTKLESSTMVPSFASIGNAPSLDNRSGL
jgi:hypothetical protein